jgi:hypothetical protein
MAILTLQSGDTLYPIAGNNTTVLGTSGLTDSVVIANGVTGTIVSSTVERADLAGNVGDFTFQQGFGSNVDVFKGGVKVASVADVAGKSLVFTDGKVNLGFDANSKVTVGGVAITTTAAPVPSPTVDTTVKSTATTTTTGGTPTFSVAGSTTVTEGNNAVFTVTLSAPQGTATTVNYTLAGTGGAVLGTDTGTAVVAGTGITSTATTLTFAPGSTTATVTVPVTFDTNAETNEGASLTLTSPSTGTSLGANAVALTAFADPAAPTFTLTSNAVAGAATTEGNTITYTITPSSVTDKAYTFTLSTVGDTLNGVATAASSADFSPAATTVTFAAGTSTAQTVVQTIVADGATEGLEGFKTTLLNSTFTPVGSSITGLVNDGSTGGTIGTSFSLTTAIDNIVGSSADDTIIGDNGTLRWHSIT